MPENNPTPVDASGGSSASKWLSISAVAAVFVIAVWFLSWALISRELGNPELPENFGDMFGAVNSPFSGLAFAGIIVAILMQREDLKLQQQELVGSRKAQEAQVRALVIAAQINAQVAMIENMEVVHQFSREFGQNPSSAQAELETIYQLLSELRELT